MLPFGLPNRDVKMIASLDHAMWFHAPFRADEWMLYDTECPRAASARALCIGR
jgi:acyl-CoA thioesterase II